MGRTSIEWCARVRADGVFEPGYSYNPWWGCEKVSPGCKHCYAETFAKRTGNRVWGGDAPRRFFGEKHWREPLKWNEEAAKAGVRARVFCASMADVFEDRRDLDPEREKLWDLIERTPSLDWLLLTKRPQNIRGFLPWSTRRGNLWLGTTAEDQERLDERAMHLVVDAGHLAAVTFLSCEPLLGPLDMRQPFQRQLAAMYGVENDMTDTRNTWASLVQWVIVGGESGGGARPFAVEWARSIVQQCRDEGTPVFVKQLGAQPITLRKGAPDDGGDLIKLRNRKGNEMAEWPEDLRIREWPEQRHFPEVAA